MDCYKVIIAMQDCRDYFGGTRAGSIGFTVELPPNPEYNRVLSKMPIEDIHNVLKKATLDAIDQYVRGKLEQEEQG